MLRAARDAGVKRVVVTSTFGAVGYGARRAATSLLLLLLLLLLLHSR